MEAQARKTNLSAKTGDKMNFNKTFLAGYLTRDPQLSYTPNQTAVVDFGIATNRKWKGQDGLEHEETCFVDCRAFGKRAEVIANHLDKGSPLFVEGRLTFDSWEAQDGSKRSKLRVTVKNFQFIGKQSEQDNQKKDAKGAEDDGDIPF